MPTKAQLAKIHIAKKELGISDDVYRDILATRFKVESASRLSPGQAEMLIRHFQGLGWKPKRKKQSKNSPRYNDAAHRKIVAMWITLHKNGVIKNGSDQALQAYVKRMTGIANLKWCDGNHCHTLIESLKKWALREDVDVN